MRIGVTKSLGARVDWHSLLVWALAIGFFIQFSGIVWLESGSARNSQTYIWLLLPALIYVLQKVGARNWHWPDAYYAPWILFLFWVGLTALWASDTETGPLNQIKRGLFIALFLVAINVLLNKREELFRRTLFAGIVVIALGALASLVYQFGWFDRPMAYRAFRIDRLGIGDFANYRWPVVAGVFHGAVATWVLGFVVNRRTDNRQAIFWLAVFAVLALYVVLTYTRGAWFGLLGSFLAVVVLQRTRRGWFLLALLMLGLLAALFIWWDKWVFEVQHRQLSNRGQIWEFFFEVMPGHWLAGHGLGTPFQFVWPGGQVTSPHAHSLYLQQIYDSGLIALALLGAGLLGLCHKAWRLRDSPWVRLAFPALVFALIAMLTDVERIYTRPGLYWTVFWLPVAVLLAVPHRAKQAVHG